MSPMMMRNALDLWNSRKFRTDSFRSGTLTISSDHWSKLTILSRSDVALCRHESHQERGAGSALPHLWREAGGEVRA